MDGRRSDDDNSMKRLGWCEASGWFRRLAIRARVQPRDRRVAAKRPKWAAAGASHSFH